MRGIISKINIKATAMQDILPFVQAPAPVTLAPSTTEIAKSQSGDGSFSESFFSMILGQYTKENEQTALNEFTQELPIVTVGGEGTLDIVTTEQEAKSIDEHLLEDLLSVVNALQQDPNTTTFPTLNASPTLEKLLASDATRQEFASVKSVSDLMDLSQKYNLGLEKLSISTETLESLQTKFPTLAQNNFFDDLQTALNTAQNTLESDATLPTPASNVINLLEKQPTQSTTPAPTTSILSELISKEMKTEPKIDTKTTQNSDLVNENDAIETLIKSEPLQVNEKQQNVITTTQVVEEVVEEVLTKPLESVIQKVANTNETKKVKTPIQTNVIVEEEPVQVAITRVNPVKAEDETNAEETHLETVLKTIKTDEVSDEAAEEEVAQTQKIVTKEETQTQTTSTDETQTTIDVKNDVKTTLKQDITSKTVAVKESLNQFANDLREKIEAYKPPIMKVELSLSPKSLGDVDVTLLTRGNNLHVNISSNTSTMSLFTQNQNDVKSALINMGFTNLEMNFSDQNNKEQAQHNQKNRSGNFDEFTTDTPEEETALLEIVIPQYV
jgi:hypothetical protein